jgi:NAD(P)-dependent dehydrogenase (short-subunit alcohol dehydrogenase family)
MTTYPNRFAGKTAVVTGAAQGIGRDVALRLAREGARVALVDRSDLVEEVRQEAGAEALAVIADLEGFAGATAAVERARARFGRIDILVNNVGGTIWAKPFAQYEEAQIEAEIRRSLFPTLWCCRAVLPVMLEEGGGVIVNVSSVATRGVNRGARHPRLRRRPNDRTGEGLVPADRGPGLLQPDQALRHDGGAGGSNPVPGLGRGVLHHRRHAARGRRRPRLNDDGRTASDQDSATEEREMSDSLMESVLVQITRVNKVQMSNGKGQT